MVISRSRAPGPWWVERGGGTVRGLTGDGAVLARANKIGGISVARNIYVGVLADDDGDGAGDDDDE